MRLIGVLLLLWVSGSSTERLDGLPIGSAAPNFRLPDLSGKQVSRTDLQGKILVLNFWAFWCDTWKGELSSLKTLAAQQDALGFHLIAISVDGTRVTEFVKRTGRSVPFSVLLDVGAKVSANYRVKHVPTVVIVDADGKIRFVHVGYPGNESVLHQIRSLLSKHG